MVDQTRMKRFSALSRLYGPDSVDYFLSCHVLIVGVGGVGSWVAEALARSGIGKFTLIDGDDVCLSNTNRQIHALTSQIGRTKVQVLESRMKDIHPEVQISTHIDFLTESSIGQLFPKELGPFDFVVDAIDGVNNKALLIAHCLKSQWPIVTSGSAGGRKNPLLIKCSDLSQVSGDPLLRKVKKILRSQYGFAQDGPWNIKAIHSSEKAEMPIICKESFHHQVVPQRLDCQNGWGSSVVVTACFGFNISSIILNELSSVATNKNY